MHLFWILFHAKRFFVSYDVTFFENKYPSGSLHGENFNEENHWDQTMSLPICFHSLLSSKSHLHFSKRSIFSLDSPSGSPIPSPLLMGYDQVLHQGAEPIKLYSRRPKKAPQATQFMESEPSPDSTNKIKVLVNDMDLPIALRKRVQKCIQCPRCI